MTPARAHVSIDADAARVICGAIRAVLEADGSVTGRGEALSRVAADALRVGADARASRSEECAAAIADPILRRAIADVLVVPACIDGNVTRARADVVRSFARAMAVESPWVDLLGALERGSVLAVKRALAARAPDARRVLARTWQEDGVRGVLGAGLFVLGLHRDAALAARFRRLGALPSGTFGRAVFEHLTSRGLPFPGEKGGMPEKMFHHDLMHVLTGYGTDPAGECELAGFYAGFADGDPFTFVMIALTTFHLGMPVSPGVVTPARGAFDPARVLAAFRRGRGVHTDVMGPWDYWASMELPLEQAAQAVGIAKVTDRA